MWRKIKKERFYISQKLVTITNIRVTLKSISSHFLVYYFELRTPLHVLTYEHKNGHNEWFS